MKAVMEFKKILLIMLISMSDYSFAEDDLTAMIKRIARETVADEIGKLGDKVTDGKKSAAKSDANAIKPPELEQYEIVSRTIRAEKILTRSLNQRVLEIEKRIDYLYENIQTVLNKTHELDHLIDNLSSNQDNVLSKAYKLITELEERKRLLVWHQTHVHEAKYREGFKGPSFISDWILMKSEDKRLSEISVDHGLGVLPSKDEVLVKPMEGPNAGWIFHGDSAFRNDDDYKPSYGGAVYLYDDTKVTLFAPNGRTVGWRSGRGTIINTGSEDGRRLGNHHQSSASALVMVKVWGPKDLPDPDFERSWQQLDVRSRSLSYYDIPHGLGDYPALVVVQIMHVGTGLVSEGVSSSVEARPWLNGGGTICGFNSESVRIWASYLPNQSSNEGTFTYQKPIGSNDGWGRTLRVKLEEDRAKFRVLVWSQKHVVPNRDFFTGNAKKDIFQFGPMSDWHKPANKDMITFYLETKSGPNKGYRFRGYGGSHAKNESFGGSVFAYSEGGLIRSWPPNPEKNGHLIHITPPYGNGKNTQISDDAEYVYTMIKTKH